MKIAVAQINTRVQDFAATPARMEATVQAAVNEGAGLVIFPQAALTGPVPVDYPDREGYQIDLFAVLRHIADSIACPCLVPVVTQLDGEPFHEVMLVHDGEIVPLRARSYVDAGEKPQASPYVTLFELGGLNMACALTYEDLDDLLDVQPAVDAVVFISDYSYALDDAASALGASLGESRFGADAVSLDAWFVGVGSLGGYGLQVYTGSSFVLSPQGGLVASAPAFEECLMFAEIDETNNQVLADVRRELFEESTFDGNSMPMDSTGVLEPEIYNRTMHLWEAIGLGLRDYVTKRSLSEVALMVDGSLASCLLCVLASDALGPAHVHALLSAPAGSECERVAQEVANALHIDLNPCEVDHSMADERPDFYMDLVRAHLAQLARETGALALSCEDKTFLALETGPCRCRVADLLPFGDVYRSDLVELAHLRNTISPVLPHEVFDFVHVPDVDGLDAAEPTPELRLRRVDVTLATYVEWERSLSDVAARQGKPDVSAAIVSCMRDAQIARESWPPCLMMSSRPLVMARGPLVAQWRDRVRDDADRLHGEDPVRKLLPTKSDSKPQEAKPTSSDFADFLRGMDVELQAGSIPEGIDQRTIEEALGDLMSLLQDFSQGGGGQPPSIEGPFGPMTWGSPFSEN